MSKLDSQEVFTEWVESITEFCSSVEIAFDNQNTNNNNFEVSINKIITNAQVINKVVRKFNREIKGLRELAIDYEVRIQELERVIKNHCAYNPNAQKHYREV